MNVEQSIKIYGLQPKTSNLDQIRRILREEIERERHQQGLGNTELIKLCCIQLFSVGQLGDVNLIWQAKTASMDSDGSVDIQLLCGAGLGETKKFLRKLNLDWSRAALTRIEECEESRDFDGFSTAEQMKFYREYYGDEPE